MLTSETSLDNVQHHIGIMNQTQSFRESCVCVCVWSKLSHPKASLCPPPPPPTNRPDEKQVSLHPILFREGRCERGLARESGTRFPIGVPLLC